MKSLLLQLCHRTKVYNYHGHVFTNNTKNTNVFIENLDIKICSEFETGADKGMIYGQNILWYYGAFLAAYSIPSKSGPDVNKDLREVSYSLKMVKLIK